MIKKKEKQIIGWREWIGMPDLGLPAVKAKVDTGARTSSLHASHIRPFTHKGAPYVRFSLNPIQQRVDIVKECVAEVADRRYVTDSNGHRQLRYVIATLLKIGEDEWPVEVTLNNRESMKFRMLLGRRALRGHMLIDPQRSFLLRKLSRKDVVKLYES